MLCLQANTNAGWIEAASRDIATLLCDHAHCERKAAMNGMYLIMHYPERDALVREMITLVEEETAHFKMVVGEIYARGMSLRRDRGNVYAKRLAEQVRTQDPERLLDSLLVDCLIEARSCERFTILAGSEAIPEELRGMYHSLMSSEEGHYLTFVDLAKIYFPHDIVDARLAELSSLEADIVRSLTNKPQMHG
jgi:tRNA-(ms[2]io[6]A)-hydroxylase